jgi:uncharacterized protein YaaN involved in tellurite resistance
MDSHSPEFQRKVQSVSQMGNQEIRRSSEVSNRFLERPAASLTKGDNSQVGQALIQLRRQVEDLDPQKNLSGRRGFFSRSALGTRARDYFHKYQSSQANLNAIIQGLYRGKDELIRDNASIEQEKVHLWQMKERLEQYAYMAERLDNALTDKVEQVEMTDPDEARSLKEDVLFYVRQKRTDVLTQLAVNMQGYLALDLVRKNNQELIKGVDRATTTTISALRTAVIVAQALTNQRLVLDQITALNTTTSNLIESTSVLLREQTGQVYAQAASATLDVQKLQTAFNNIYATMDMVDKFKVQALDNMRTTVNTLQTEVTKAQTYMDRVRTAEIGQAHAARLTSGTGDELALPGGR